MKEVLRAQCPGCSRALRIPAEWSNRPLRCKHCGQYVLPQANGHGAAPVANSNGPAAAAPAAPVAYTPPVGDGEVAFTPDSIPGEAPQGTYVPAFLPGVDTRSSRPYRPPTQRRSSSVYVLGGLCLALLAVVGVLIAKPDLLNFGGSGNSPEQEQAKGGNDPEGRAEIPFEEGQFPRRMLSINPCNYLYANPVYSGKAVGVSAYDSRAVHDAVMKIADKWRIPRDQVFELSDALEGDAATPPLKPIIEGAIQALLGTSRPQDRLVLLYTGHALEIDGEAYLVPLEGEFDVPETLIPVSWVYAELEKCPAQEKLVIFDVCRTNPQRGEERATAGAMTPELEAILHAPPRGVSVWTACSAEQYSWEYEYKGNGKGQVAYGSVFMNSFFYASQQGKLGDSLENPSDPLPLERASPLITDLTNQFVNIVEKLDQTPKFTRMPPAMQVTFDPKLPPPSPFPMPQPPPGADKAELAALMDEIRVPPIKISRRGEAPFLVEEVFPFEKEIMDEYQDEGLTREQILRAPDLYPVREITLRAVDILRDLRDSEDEGAQVLPEEFRGENSDAAKAEILRIQRFVATPVRIIGELNSEMDLIADQYLEFETSKRWRVNFEYVRAQVKARLAYLNEYNLMLGKVRKDEMPPLEEGETGWRLASVERMSSPRDIRDIADQATDILEAIIEENPGTPWAVLSKRQKFTSLGLKWEGSNFGL